MKDTIIYKGVAYRPATWVLKETGISKQRLHQIRAGYYSPNSKRHDSPVDWDDDRRLIMGVDYIIYRTHYYYYSQTAVDKIKKRIR